MSNRNIINALAMVGAILVLVGVTFAATSALADGHGDVVSRAVAIHGAAETSADTAARAHAEAAERAAERIALANELDLDIRLLDRRSDQVARQ